MKTRKLFSSRTGVVLALAILLQACATPPTPYDYSAFKQARPASLLVLPPLNDSPEVNATAGVWAQSVRPLAEGGYYVFPITLVAETFRQNGLDNAADIQEVSPQKLHEFFGADAAVYIRVIDYGTTYKVLSSDTRVAVEGKIIDLRSGQLLWQGQAAASSAEQQQNQGGLIGVLVAAVIKQISDTVTDAAFNYAAIADYRLLGAAQPNGVLTGPRSPHSQQAK